MQEKLTVRQKLHRSLRNKAAELYEGTTTEERAQWLSHPLTKSLLASLEVDVLEQQDLWSNGAFTAEGADGTLQRNSEAIGRVSSIEETVQIIRELGGVKMEEEETYDYSDGA